MRFLQRMEGTSTHCLGTWPQQEDPWHLQVRIVEWECPGQKRVLNAAVGAMGGRELSQTEKQAPVHRAPLSISESPELSWRDGSTGHSTLPRTPQCTASSELSGPSTPLHTSSPVQGKERYTEGHGYLGTFCGVSSPRQGLSDHLHFSCSTRQQDTRSSSLAPTQRLGPGEALPPVVQGGTEKAPELLASSRPEPPDLSPFSQTSPPSSPNGWPQERSPGSHPNSASPRGPVPTTLPGLHHAPWRGPPDSPDGSPLTPVPTQMPWLVASPEPPQSSPTPAFPLTASYDASGPTQPPLPEKRHLPGSGQQPSPPARATSQHVTFAPPLPDVTQPPGIRGL